jgi:hypothetical protein
MAFIWNLRRESWHLQKHYIIASRTHSTREELLTSFYYILSFSRQLELSWRSSSFHATYLLMYNFNDTARMLCSTTATMITLWRPMMINTHKKYFIVLIIYEENYGIYLRSRNPFTLPPYHPSTPHTVPINKFLYNISLHILQLEALHLYV